MSSTALLSNFVNRGPACGPVITFPTFLRHIRWSHNTANFRSRPVKIERTRTLPVNEVELKILTGLMIHCLLKRNTLSTSRIPTTRPIPPLAKPVDHRGRPTDMAPNSVISGVLGNLQAYGSQVAVTRLKIYLLSKEAWDGWHIGFS